MVGTGQIPVPLAATGRWLDLLFYGTCLAVALLAAALVIALVRRWARKGESSPSASDQLSQYRALYQRGEISQEEFDRLRAVLGGELTAGAKLAPPRPPVPKPTNAPPPPPNGVQPE
ncbi:MAG TPA: SHOCT domain-containing protein [Gemmataceae bacterium]|nr:SHOCT domain-containing protein [Gemmataceae bacterium]